jgi:hypothetical protein
VINSCSLSRHAAVTKRVPNFARLYPSLPAVAILVEAMLKARDVFASRPVAASQEPTTEHWWADVLADPRARIWQARGLSGRDGRRTARKSHYRLADESSPVIEVACSKCEWKATFSRAELLSMYGAECPLPTLLNHLAMPGCSKVNTHWDRCGVYYVHPIDGRETVWSGLPRARNSGRGAGWSDFQCPGLVRLPSNTIQPTPWLA